MSKAWRPLRLLVAIAGAEQPPTHTDLARSTGMPKSTISVLLHELEALGFVSSEEKRYVAGPALLSLGYQVTLRSNGDRRLAPGVRDVLEALAESTGESVALSIEVGGSDGTPGLVLAIEDVEGPQPVRFVRRRAGELMPMYRTAAGRVFLAFSGRSAAALPKESLERVTPATLVDPSEIDAELERVRRRGYALSVDESYEGVTSVAAPVPGDDGRPVAAISVSGPTQRLLPAETTVWPALRDAAARVREREHARRARVATSGRSRRDELRR
jgi:DNA-binding IclR family transcriptional regulator